MSETKKPFNILEVFHIRYKKKTPEQLKYANFNRRMFAFTLDSMILMLTVAPLVDHMFNTFYPPVIDMVQLRKELAATSPELQTPLFLERMRDSGAFSRWFDNVLYQVGVFLVLSGLCWRQWGGTPGKILMRIKIVDAKTEQAISFQQILLRLFGYLISVTFFLLGFLWIGLDKRKQGWHDKLADTVVITLPLGGKGLYQRCKLLVGKITRNHKQRRK